jgi:hypothetical protein
LFEPKYDREYIKQKPRVDQQLIPMIHNAEPVRDSKLVLRDSSLPIQLCPKNPTITSSLYLLYKTHSPFSCSSEQHKPTSPKREEKVYSSK